MPNEYYGFDWTYIVLVLPAFVLSLICQILVKTTFNKYSKVPVQNGLTGLQAARTILDESGLRQIAIEHVQGTLSDHYDHTANAIRLSDSTFASASVGAVGVAAHEAGHAVQYAENYGPIRLRTAMVPVCNFGANAGWLVMLIGIAMNRNALLLVGILLFSLSVAFQLVTLPVEFNASRRAVAILEGRGMLTEEELKGAKKVLRAAAMTYVAALAVSLANLLRYILIFSGRRSRH